ncbi:hypothetical protein GCM10010472_01660 [Pseudonocardia halophobica]|uniref:Linalool dehydratase/isomerase domain-containing protein n=1 Tax=Pseudonocardia halophobica TaxID=29401 RepID=A0A9W6L1L6_9PSEU|nr:hypothetical protein [Pseudonocardia halophobica]GLL10506.1 hypothetical protein GCM10017577_16460 [Pseudonocardia halophobica]
MGNTLTRKARLTIAALAAGASVASAVGAVRTKAAPALPESGGEAPPVDVESILIPEREHRFGQATRAAMRRVGLSVTAGQLAGLALSLVPDRPRLNAFGAGLIAPGLGHLATGRPVGAVGAAASLPASLTAFFSTGMNVAPPLAWVGSAVHAGLRNRTGRAVSPAVPAIAATAIAGAYGVEALRRKALLARQQEQGAGVNQYLSTVTPPLRGTDAPEVAVAEELDDVELALVRRLVDISLQEANDWSNYELIDQFRESAVRYSMTGNMRALQALQYARMPAFRGYVSEAQRQLILKHQQPLVWKYWFWENLWGNLSLNPDPMVRQNIMLGGWLSTTIGAYERLTGDYRFNEPDSLSFVVNSRLSFSYSYETMLAVLADQFEKSPYGLVACEPNWIYTLCNTFGVAGAYLHSKIHGSDLFDRIGPGYVAGFQEEFLGPEGLTRAYMSTRTGLSGPSATGILTAAYQRPFAPNLADRAWALTKGAFETRPDGAVRLKSGKGVFDPGNYSTNGTYGTALIAGAMREAGEEELALGALAGIQEKHDVYVNDRGWLQVEGASGMAHAEVAHSMFARKGTWLNLMSKGMPEHWRTGPLLESVPYPEVLVGRAVSNDGEDLEVVLHPGSGSGRRTVELSQLVPGRRYKAQGAVQQQFDADSSGAASVEVDVEGRTELHVVPA